MDRLKYIRLNDLKLEDTVWLKILQGIVFIIQGAVRFFNKLSLDGSSARSRGNWLVSMLAVFFLVTLVAVSGYSVEEYVLNRELAKTNSSLHNEIGELKAQLLKYEPAAIIVDQNKSLLEQNYDLGDKIMQLRLENLALDEENFRLKKEALRCE